MPARRLLALAPTLLAAAGCLHFDTLEEPVKISTHAEDWREAVIYQVLIDRFDDGDDGNNYLLDRENMARYHGGDWIGLENRLDYIQELGVNTLWISPVIKNIETDANVDGYHGYWAVDLTQPNAHFGNLDDLRSLVQAAHERDMLVVIDIVANHMGQLFFYDMNLNGVPDILLQGTGTRPQGTPVPGGFDQSGFTHITEYDPDFNPLGIQAFTSLGPAGPAPIVFPFDPKSGHVTPMPPIFQNPEVYNRKGRTFNYDDPQQLLTGDFPGGLKDVNTTRCDVKQAFVDSYARWIELTDADGFRIDTVKHVEREFWRYFSQRVRQRLAAQGKTKFFMFGEAFDGRDELVGSFTKNDLPSDEELARENSCDDGPKITGDQLDSAFYFPQHYQVFRDVFQDGASTDRIANLWANKTVNYGTVAPKDSAGIPPHKVLVNFIDNHDVARFLYFARERVDAHPAFAGKSVRDKELRLRAMLQNALLMLMTAEGVPCLYYGTELEYRGGNDPSNREDMWRPYPYLGDTVAPPAFDTTGPTFVFTKKLIEYRKKLAALRRGDTKVVWSTARTGDESDAGIFAFERAGGEAGNNYVLVVFNTNQNHDSRTQFEGTTMTVSAPAGAVLVDVLGGNKKYTVGAGGSLDLTLPPVSGMLLVPQQDV
ncbi:Glycosidase [Nannocystis exedens]|uniref:alpha-amylase n=1 Tax=Nannocystis exedens TaxID=54 RepID=A0A1I2GBK0_9BACT|nr:alpha-amylase family glycosyl hydrolase [Nannocystis exedens]PCC67405.1 alpha-amylase [Nannocystis exedens]SFF14499.1 Glycosidase [Nannocystis exedens]